MEKGGMKVSYADWIAAYAAKHNGFVRGRCHEATRAMVAAFPDLRRVAGFAIWTSNRPVRDQHWWCVAPDGMIVDPTRAQFGWGAQVTYEPLDLNNLADVARIPTGRCMDCGGDTYNGNAFCNESCEAATRKFMGISS